ncbi:hypothetical protein L596_029616 [Steinernema carpocapsae]|uniref:Uncharacterized protein n=1 Tax=Steinernema carpocapsae TaxID=34508 RepID=A0A4V5ZXJ0_STECR|nr:hypothetical protein L596_029616 [Steinernema carpocapsae]
MSASQAGWRAGFANRAGRLAIRLPKLETLKFRPFSCMQRRVFLQFRIRHNHALLKDMQLISTERKRRNIISTLCARVYDGEYLDQAYSADFVGLRRFNYIGEPRQARKHVLRSLITKWDTLHRYLRRLAKTEDPKYKFNLALERWKMAPSEANKTRVFEALFSKRIKTLQKLVTDYFSWPDEESLAKIEGYRRRRGFSKALITILASEWRETASGLHDMASSDEAKEFYKSLSDPNAITLHKPQSATMETE